MIQAIVKKKTIPQSGPFYLFPIVCDSLRKRIVTDTYDRRPLLTQIIAVYTFQAICSS